MALKRHASGNQSRIGSIRTLRADFPLVHAAVSDLICDVDFVSRADYVPDVDPRLQLGVVSPREKAAIFCNNIGSTEMHGITDVPAALLKQLHAIITLYQRFPRNV